MDDDQPLIDLGRRGSRLTVRLGAPYAPDAVDPETRAWRHATIDVEAHPFSGTVSTILTAQDVQQYRALADDFTSGRRDRVTLGGDRAAEVVLQRHERVVEVSVTPSGDDPWPLLRFLIVST